MSERLYLVTFSGLTWLVGVALATAVVAIVVDRVLFPPKK